MVGKAWQSSVRIKFSRRRPSASPLTLAMMLHHRRNNGNKKQTVCQKHHSPPESLDFALNQTTAH
jgi:hypothetical protein